MENSNSSARLVAGDLPQVIGSDGKARRSWERYDYLVRFDELFRPGKKSFGFVLRFRVCQRPRPRVTLSEEVQNFATTTGADAAKRVTLTGGSDIASVTATKIEKDDVDKTKYTVTLSGSALNLVDSALANLKIFVKGNDDSLTPITDLSGEEMKADYAKIITVAKDQVKPKLVSTNIVEKDQLIKVNR